MDVITYPCWEGAISVCLCSVAWLTGIDHDVLLWPTDATYGSLQFMSPIPASLDTDLWVQGLALLTLSWDKILVN